MKIWQQLVHWIAQTVPNPQSILLICDVDACISSWCFLSFYVSTWQHWTTTGGVPESVVHVYQRIDGMWKNTIILRTGILTGVIPIVGVHSSGLISITPASLDVFLFERDVEGEWHLQLLFRCLLSDAQYTYLIIS